MSRRIRGAGRIVNLKVMSTQLDHPHRETLDRIFARPSSGNVEWRQVLSLLEALGAVRRLHNGKLEIRLGSEIETVERPAGKDVDEQLLEDLRRILLSAGYVPSTRRRNP